MVAKQVVGAIAHESIKQKIRSGVASKVAMDGYLSFQFVQSVNERFVPIF